MYNDAYKIFEYLPIRRDKLEDEYIKHLWDAFAILDFGVEPGRLFSIMPFHLLYMLALQYKVIRISSELPDKYKLAFTVCNSRDKEQILKPKSVFDIASLHERTIPDIFGLIGVNNETIKNSKRLIDNRNDRLAHAKGGIEYDPEKKIIEYLLNLRDIQEYMLILNDKIAESWILKIMEKDIQNSELQNFIESQLLGTRLCSADFKQGKLDVHFRSCINLE